MIKLTSSMRKNILKNNLKGIGIKIGKISFEKALNNLPTWLP